MRRRSLVLLILVVLAIFSSLPLAQSSRHNSHVQSKGQRGEKKKLRPWPCCDNCGGCTRSFPPQCQCLDMTRGCHPMCKDCVKSALSVEPPMYQCMDRITNFCKYRCTTASH